MEKKRIKLIKREAETVIKVGIIGIFLISITTFSLEGATLIIAATQPSIRQLCLIYIQPLVVTSVILLGVGLALTKIVEKHVRDLDFLYKFRGMFVYLLIMLPLFELFILRVP